MAVTTNQRSTTTTSTAPGPATSATIGLIIRYGLLTVFAIIAFMPFVLSFLGTFKNNNELIAYPPTFFPNQWINTNWVRVWNFSLPSFEGILFPRWLFNSLWLAVVNVFTQLFFCSLAAYAFARIPFPGRNLIFSIALATMTIPFAVTLIPGFVFFAKLGWINTFWPLIIPNLVSVSGIYILAQFFRAIPKELEEAAFMDGLGRFGTYRVIALPLARPALITLAILQFQASWNNYIQPLLFLQKPDIMTLTVGMGFFKGQFSNDYSAQLVGAMFNAIPVLLLFFIFSKYFTNSGSTAGLAGQ